MNHRILTGALGLITGIVAAPASALDASDITSDVRCMVVAGQIVSSADPEHQAAAKMLGVFFMGKIMGKQPAADLADLMAKEIGRMSAADLRAEAQRCGGELSDAGKRMKDAGAELIRGNNEAPKTSVPPAG